MPQNAKSQSVTPVPPSSALPPHSRHRPIRAEIVDTVRSVAVVLCAVLAIQTVAFQPFTIPTPSMEPGLVAGDYLVVSKFAYGWSRASLPFHPPLAPGRLFGRLPARGDVVVFRHPTNPRETWIKRVIGLPGDRVQITGGAVIVNGRVLPQRALDRDPGPDAPLGAVARVLERQADGRAYVTLNMGTDLAGDDRAVETVPDGFLFVMGDHRDNSLDSRWAGDVGVGLLPVENLVGRAEIVVASWRPGAALYKPWTWFNVRPDRMMTPIR